MSRLIIALDQDNFYVGVARRLDPSLNGRAIGITQKSLLATVSYEARALGLGKLQSIRSAVEVVRGLGGVVRRPGEERGEEPVELVLVDGEDLSAYRRASGAVKWVVDGVVGVGEGGRKRKREPEYTTRSFPGAEKLGMDEVFIDVTSLVDAHLASNPPRNEKGETYFHLPRTAERVLQIPDADACERTGLECGFWYPPTLAGTVVPSRKTVDTVNPGTSDINNDKPSEDTQQPSPSSLGPPQRLAAATHLCAYLRELILRKTGLSSSGGVAGCKMVSKMMVRVGKPAGQAVWVGDADAWAGGADEGLCVVEESADSKDLRQLSSHDVKETNRSPALQNFLDPLPVRSIQGFGSAVLATLRTAYPVISETPTIHDIRTIVPQAAFRRLFSTAQANTLWGLLHGIDEAPVKPSPRFPAQISVEDSFAATLWRPLPVIRAQAVVLLEKLLERMEEELTCPPGDPYPRGINFRPPSNLVDTKWIRYPSQLRMTIRTYRSTQSKSTSIPAFVFETGIARRERAERTMKGLGDRVIQSLLGKGREGVEGEREYEVYVINIAVTDLRSTAPPPSFTAQRPHIDLDVLAALPPEIREEMAQRYGLPSGGRVKGEVIELSDDDESVVDGALGVTAIPARDDTSVGKLEPVGSQNLYLAEVVPMDTHPEARLDAEIAADEKLPQNGREPEEPHLDNSQRDSVSSASDEEGDEDGGPCSRCGTYVFGFAASAHARWHEQAEEEES